MNLLNIRYQIGVNICEYNPAYIQDHPGECGIQHACLIYKRGSTL